MSSGYYAVYPSFWTLSNFRALSPSARDLFWYAWTSPHRNMSGFYSLPEAYVLRDLSVTRQKFAEALAACTGFLAYDREDESILLVHALQAGYGQPPVSPQQLKGLLTCLLQAPQSPGLRVAMAAILDANLPGFMAVHGENLRQAWGRDTLAIPYADTQDTVSAETAAAADAAVKAPKGPKGPDDDPEFLAAYRDYPRKVGRYEAWKNWRALLDGRHKLQKHVRGPVTAERLHGAIRHYAANCRQKRLEDTSILHMSAFFGPEKARFLDYLTGGESDASRGLLGQAEEGADYRGVIPGPSSGL